MIRFPKPTSPPAKDTRGIMIPRQAAKQPKLVVPSKVMGKAAKKASKKRVITQQQGRRTLTSVD